MRGSGCEAGKPGKRIIALNTASPAQVRLLDARNDAGRNCPKSIASTPNRIQIALATPNPIFAECLAGPAP